MVVLFSGQETDLKMLTASLAKATELLKTLGPTFLKLQPIDYFRQNPPSHVNAFVCPTPHTQFIKHAFR